MSDSELQDFAQDAGLEVRWTDIGGKTHTVTPDVLRAVLRALGYAAGNRQEIAQSRQQLQSESGSVPELVTAWVGEDFSVGGERYRAPDQAGYHAIEINGVRTTLATAPRRCFSVYDLSDQRLAGLGVQIYGLRGGTSAGFGDFSALAEFSSRAAKRGIAAIAISPVHALFSADSSHISPYSPSSRVFLNPLYAAHGSPGVRPSDGNGNDFVDWPAAAEQKFAALRTAFEQFDPHDNEAFVAFCKKGGERLHRHALFEVLNGHFRQQNLVSWREWPAPFRDPAHHDVLRFAVGHQREIEFQLYLQFITMQSAERTQQIARDAGMPIGIIADLATGIDPNGSDCWAAPEDVLSGLRIGAPPDLFNAAGQNWGITALSPAQLRRNAFSPFIAMLRGNMGFAGGVRIDHAMGLMRLWVIPEGAGGVDGVYLRYPFPDLLRLICLESHRAKAIVIGEDLGTVPQGFGETLAYRGISGMQVLWFQKEWDGTFVAPSRWRQDAVAMTTTHDLPTVAGWWTGRDIEWRAIAGVPSPIGDEVADRNDRNLLKQKLWSALVDAQSVAPSPQPSEPEDVIDGTISFVAKTPCRLAIIAAEDICGLREQPNLPGTIHEHPNWRRRLPVGDFFSLPRVPERLSRFVAGRRS